MSILPDGYKEKKIHGIQTPTMGLPEAGTGSDKNHFSETATGCALQQFSSMKMQGNH